MNKKQSFILCAICFVVALICLFLAFWVNNNVDPLKKRPEYDKVQVESEITFSTLDITTFD